jgi:LysR family glycine cleavage system transcriptional activator
MRQTLPPFAALIAFEAAGRLQSFTKAAEELHVTQAAVSRQIRLLEERIGKPLFVRAHRSVELTTEGRNYLHTVVNALSEVSAATRDLMAADSASRLVLAADQSIAHLWLMPRLAAFRAAYPGFDLGLVVSDEERACLAANVDVTLLHGDGNWPSHDTELLFAEEVFPVCSPDYLGERRGRLRPEDIASETLIDLDDDHWNWLNWRQWLNAHGAGEAAAPRSLVTSSYPLAIDAARRGLGLALGWRGLVDADLKAGGLVAPLRETMRTRFGYHLAWPRERTPTPAALAFIAWAKAG